MEVSLERRGGVIMYNREWGLGPGHMATKEGSM